MLAALPGYTIAYRHISITFHCFGLLNVDARRHAARIKMRFCDLQAASLAAIWTPSRGIKVVSSPLAEHGCGKWPEGFTAE